LPTHGRPIRLLVVESNPADAYLTLEALKQVAPVEYVTAIDDGPSALAYLRHGGALSPDVVFLDLNLTPMSGFEVLTEIRSTPSLAFIPIVILSGSRNAGDVRKAYQLGANCYVTKPTNLDEFLKSIKACYEFWGTIATLPPKQAGA
jgi:two-component system, chemotaxis family, response regulator Rcp1